MFIIYLSSGRKVKIDADELEKLANLQGTKGLIPFRQGMVNPSFIVSVEEDEDRKSEVTRRVGESEEDRQKRIKKTKSDDIFEQFRSNNKLLS